VAASGLPHATQVADRWHRMENATAAFLDAVRESMRSIRFAIGATTINPGLLACAERLEYIVAGEMVVSALRISFFIGMTTEYNGLLG